MNEEQKAAIAQYGQAHDMVMGALFSASTAKPAHKPGFQFTIDGVTFTVDGHYQKGAGVGYHNGEAIDPPETSEFEITHVWIGEHDVSDLLCNWCVTLWDELTRRALEASE
jgi:hypothetical protein